MPTCFQAAIALKPVSLLGCNLTADQEIVTARGTVGETLRVPTANPRNFFEAISDPGAMERTEILGKLFLPAGQGPWPVVVIVPGSLGIAPSHVAKADLLNEAGIAACLIDPFGTRGVTSTVANQAQFSFAASAWDVLASVAVLAAREAIDAARIGAQGHSRGGSAVLSAACMARLETVDVRSGLRAIYAAYPWSGQQFLSPFVGDTLVRAVIGDQDEWCLAQQVQGHIQAIRLCGGDASCRIFAGAHHSFDRGTPLELIAEASVSPGAPTVYIREDGAFVHPADGRADPAFTDRELMMYGIKAGYGRRGAHLGSEGDQADRFHEDMMAFWIKALGVG
jgi:dienelactone hydrolase